MTSDPRCLARAKITPDQWKRCVRATGHAEPHLWVESLDRVGGRPVLASWKDPADSHPIMATVYVDEDFEYRG